MRRLWEGESLEVAGAKENIMVGEGKYFSMSPRCHVIPNVPSKLGAYFYSRLSLVPSDRPSVVCLFTAIVPPCRASVTFAWL